VLLGTIFLRNPHMHWHEKFVIVPVAMVLAFAALFGGTFWTYSHWPPKFLFHLDSGSYSNPPCCWQAVGCGGLSPSDYGLFRCRTSQQISAAGNSHMTSTLTAGSEAFHTCSDLKAYSLDSGASSQLGI
jgi:hypothetical protein